MSGPEYDYDAEFEAYLRRRVRLDRRFRVFDRLEPPPQLDRIIIRRAHAAIRPAVSAPSLHAPKWAAPLALAATLLVSFSLMLDVGLRQAAHHDALSAPMVLEMEMPKGQEPAAESDTLAPAAPVAAGKALRTSPVLRVPHPKAQAARNSNAAAPVGGVSPAAAGVATTRAAQGDGGMGVASRYMGGYGPAPIRLAIASPQMQTVVVVGRRQDMQQVGTFMSDFSAEAVENMRNMAHMHQDPLTIPIPDLPSNLLGGGSGSATPTIRD